MTPETAGPRWFRREVFIVLGLSLGASAVFSFVDIIERLLAPVPLQQQTASLNGSYSPSEYFDLLLQLLNVATMLAPVALCLLLMAMVIQNTSWRLRDAAQRIGFDLTKLWRDIGLGFLLAAGIGIPGLGLYALGRHFGFSVSVQASTLDSFWWTIPILILRAAANGILEEVIMVGYLMDRLPRLGPRWLRSRWGAQIASSLVRGSYHLYQGFGGFIGNFVMGLIFTEFYRRNGRTMPLILAHTLLDIVAFVGYTLLASHWGFLR